MDISIDGLTHLDPISRNSLAQILIDSVAEDASVGFLAPLAASDARDFWDGVLAPHVRLLVARAEGTIVGTVQLQLVTRPNGLHRAEVAKLLVAPAARRQGIARRLMLAIESVAREEQRSLLVLDTREGDPSNHLYRSMGYAEAGRIPQFCRSNGGSLDATVVYFKIL